MNRDLLNLFIDSFPKILIPGLTATVPLTVIAFFFAMVIAVAAAMAQFARVPSVAQLCRLYIWALGPSSGWTKRSIERKS